MLARRLGSLALHTLTAVATSGAGLWVVAALGYGPAAPRDLWLRALLWIVPLRLGAFLAAGITETLWRYTGIWDLRNLLLAIGASSTLFAGLCAVVPSLSGYPSGAVAIDSALLFLALGVARLLARLTPRRGRHDTPRRVLIFGAGDAGELIVRDMKRQGSYRPVGFVDDDAAKQGRRIHGVPVLGTREDLPRAIERTRPDEILVAMPSVDHSVLRGVVRALEPFTLPIRTLPGLQQLMRGRVSVGHIHDLVIEDLLRRDPVGLSLAAVRELVAGRRVLVTGAGGSIGSELCRQIAVLSPASLVMVDRYENGLHGVAGDLRDTPGARPLICDITDAARLEMVMRDTCPELVFHAAAHKHVPLMEANVCEAVKNNVTGTRMLVEAAARHGASHFVLISTDKAVRPSSVMGASKRIAELIVQDAGQRIPTRFVTVRFGNVLGSNGSVVPTFVAQIRAGGPVTVTHPDVRRFFMLIPESVQLVLHAAALAPHGSIAVLDMGEQIRVLDLARHMIRLAGFVPDEEIPIVFTGLRPGEKLSEELVGDGEELQPSPLPAISWVDSRDARDWCGFQRDLAALELAAREGDEAVTRAALAAMLPEFVSPQLTTGGAGVSGPAMRC